MEVTSHCNSNDIIESQAKENLDQSGCSLSQPAANGTLQHHSTGVASSSVSAPVCTSPSLLPPSTTPPLSQSSNCNHPHHHHHQKSINQKHLSSTKSHASLKTDAAHIKKVAGDDCCVHCLLACLFCELLSMFSAVGECLACGLAGAGCCDGVVSGCCCCVEAAGEVACTEEACQAVWDCGILEDCCGSSDCLEICVECCSICFPS